MWVCVSRRGGGGGGGGDLDAEMTLNPPIDSMSSYTVETKFILYSTHEKVLPLFTACP